MTLEQINNAIQLAIDANNQVELDRFANLLAQIPDLRPATTFSEAK